MANELTVEINGDDSGLQETFGKIKTGLAVAGVAAAAAGLAIAKGLGENIMRVTNDFSEGISKFQIQTGATTKEMEGLGKTIKELYTEGFGESMTDISQGMVIVKQQSAILNTSTTKDIKEITKYALLLKDSFDIELNESIRTSGNLVKNFGMTGKEALDFIAKGMQMGLNQSDDLLDTLYEYSPQFSKIGLGANDMFNILKKGSESGIFTLDKVGDAIKEFGIRVTDGSTGTSDAMKMIGLNAKEMGTAFLAGGEEGNKAFYKIINALGQVKNPLDQNTAGVALFGTMWEDLGAKTVLSLGTMDSKLVETKGTLDEINKIRMDTINAQIEEFKRTLETGILLPIGEKLIPRLKEWTSKLDDVKQGLYMSGILEASQKEIETWGAKVSDTSKNTQKLVKVLKDIVDVVNKISEGTGKVIDFFSTVDKEGKKVSKQMDEVPILGHFNKWVDGIFEADGKLKGFDFSPTGKKIGDDYSKGLLQSDPMVKGSLVQIGDISKLYKPEAYTFGVNTSVGYASGINSGKGTTDNAINNVLGNVPTFNKSGQTYNFGLNTSNSYASGINSGKGNVTNSTENVKQALNNLQTADRSYWWGYNLVDQLTSGIYAGLGSVKKACSSVAQAIADFFPHSPAKTGALHTFPETGYTLMDQLMEGIYASQGKLNTLTANVASSINSNISVTPGNMQQSNLQVPIYLDGKKISEVTAPYMVRSLRQQGF